MIRWLWRVCYSNRKISHTDGLLENPENFSSSGRCKNKLFWCHYIYITNLVSQNHDKIATCKRSHSSSEKFSNQSQSILSFILKCLWNVLFHIKEIWLLDNAMLIFCKCGNHPDLWYLISQFTIHLLQSNSVWDLYLTYCRENRWVSINSVPQENKPHTSPTAWKSRYMY